MRPFAYKSPSDMREAATGSAENNTAFIAGGTTMIDLMKETRKPRPEENVVRVRGGKC